MIDPQLYRDAMSRLAAAVNIITSDGEGGLCGSTASAVCSVSDAPPILLVCINRNSRNNTVLKLNKQLCVNVLNADQQHLALQFARSGADANERFQGVSWSLSKHVSTGDATPQSPLLEGALVSLSCAITGAAEIGTHTVFYCTVESVHIGSQGDALVYFERNFCRLGTPD